MKQLPILFGAAYYEEYLPYDRLREDFEMMKKASFNVVRIAESTWSTEEPEDGVFDFSHIDRVLDMAKEYGMYVIIGTPTYAVPYWLVKKDPGVLAETASGREKYGRRQNMNIINPTYRFHAERIIRKIAEHTANHPNVIGFQLDNETKHYGTASADVQKLFRDYLKDKFKTIDALNKEFGFAYWSNSVTSFDDLPDVTGTINGSYACAFAEFQRKLASDFLKWQSDIVKEYARPDQFITQNFDYEWCSFGAPGTQDGYSRGVQPDICHFDAAKALNIAGTDVYHNTQDDLTGMEISFAGDEMRRLINGNDNYIVLETQAQAFRQWLPYPGQLRLQALSHVASGSTGILYWNFFSIHNSKETYWKGLLSHDFRENPTYLEACETGKELAKITDKIGSVKIENRVALMISNNSLSALKEFPTDKDLSYNDIVLSYYNALYRSNISVDIVFDNAPDWENKYDVIITPALYTVSEETTKRIRQFVENGGTLISSFRSFVANENVKVSCQPLPAGMTDVFGATYNQYTKPVNVTVCGEKPEYWMELLVPDTAKTIGNYQHKYYRNYSAVVRNSFGKGQAFYIGCYFEWQALENILSDIIPADYRVSEREFPLIVKRGKSENGKEILFVFNYSSDDNYFDITFDCTDILTDKEYKKGDKAPMADWGALLLEVN